MDGLSISGRLLAWIAAVMTVRLWYAPMMNDVGIDQRRIWFL